MEIDLDNVATDVNYPIAEPVEGLIQQPDVEITALNDVFLRLNGITRTGQDLYIMLSVESGKQRLFANYCLDITDK